jgi:hypothetical protein
MEEHGISKIVSVKFHKADEPTLGLTSTPLVPPAAGAQVEIAEDKQNTREETLDIAMAK